MSNPPAFQLYAGDFFLDTMEWELEEIGLYSRLLFYEWINGPLPIEPRKLAKISLIGPRKLAQLWPKIERKFIEKDGFYVNIRLEETREKQRQFIESQREKGKKRAEKRWHKGIATATNGLQPKDSSSSSSSIISTNVDMSPNGNCPHQTLINLFHEKLPMLPRVRVWTDARKKTLSTRWKENEDQHTLEWWEAFFEHIAKSKFLTGRTQDKHGKPFLATLAWIIKAENFAKIIEGNYDD